MIAYLYFLFFFILDMQRKFSSLVDGLSGPQPRILYWRLGRFYSILVFLVVHYSQTY